MICRLSLSALLGICLLLPATKAHAEDANAVFARFKAASGGAQWDSVHSLLSTRAFNGGGLSGEDRQLRDLLTGRSSEIYQMGPVDGADGYDGTHAWERDAGGEVSVQDTPKAIRNARSQAWLDACAYWYPQRMPATYGIVETRELDGKQFNVIKAIPDGGDPVTLWFSIDTGLMARIVQLDGEGGVETTVLDDYRKVDGVLLPRHLMSDDTDAAGRTDPRNHLDIRIDHVNIHAVVSDSDFVAPIMVSTAHINDASGTTRVPFDLVNNHIYVDGAVDGKPVRLMFDTGAGNLLTPTAARRLGLTSKGKLANSGAGEQLIDLGFARAKQVRVGAATLADPVFAVTSLGDLPKVEGVPLDGLVGYEMFRRFGVTIDYAKKQLTLSEPKKFMPPPGAIALTFDLDGHHAVIPGTLDGIPVRLIVDTGSRGSLVMTAAFVHAHDLTSQYGASPEAVTGWGVNGGSRGRPARFGTLRLGGLDIDGIAGDLFIGDKGALANPDWSGDLGGGVLHRFTLAFDYPNKKIYFAPNAEIGKPYAFDRSGLWLLVDGDALKVVDIAKDSAAEHAGLHVADRISAIDGALISTKSLSDWRQQLRELPVGTRLAVRFQRDGKSSDATLTLADRMPAVAKHIAGTGTANGKAAKE
jgi:predicted aspartyl protease